MPKLTAVVDVGRRPYPKPDLSTKPKGLSCPAGSGLLQ
jgi:hypothetical protein